MHIFLMCRSLTSAQKAARVLKNNRVFASVTKAPQSANPGGCTYGVKIGERNLELALELLERAGITIEKTFELPEAAGRGVLL